MPSYTTADIRNVLLVGHGGCGKTTIADALLYEAKAVTRRGSVADGTSFSDFEKEEREHKHSIYSAVLHLDYQGNTLVVPRADRLGCRVRGLAGVRRRRGTPRARRAGCRWGP